MIDASETYQCQARASSSIFKFPPRSPLLSIRNHEFWWNFWDSCLDNPSPFVLCCWRHYLELKPIYFSSSWSLSLRCRIYQFRKCFLVDGHRSDNIDNPMILCRYHSVSVEHRHTTFIGVVCLFCLKLEVTICPWLTLPNDVSIRINFCGVCSSICELIRPQDVGIIHARCSTSYF